MSDQLVDDPICMGTVLLTVVPSPSCPSSLEPQAQRVPDKITGGVAVDVAVGLGVGVGVIVGVAVGVGVGVAVGMDGT